MDSPRYVKLMADGSLIKSKPICTLPDCKRASHMNGLCFTHSGAKRISSQCKMPECKLPSNTGEGYCRDHTPNQKPKCEIEHCRNVCFREFAKCRRHSIVECGIVIDYEVRELVKQTSPTKKCRTIGCKTRVKVGNVCAKHKKTLRPSLSM